MVADCSFIRSLTAFPMVCAPFRSADGSTLLILPLVNGIPDGLRAVLLSEWQWIAHCSARQWLLQRFAHHIALWMALDCSFFRWLTAFTTVCALYCSADCSADGTAACLWVHSYLPLVDDFANILRAIDCSP